MTQVQDLISLAEAALRQATSDVPQFLVEAESYLDRFEHWESEFRAMTPSAESLKPEEIVQLEELNRFHTELLATARRLSLDVQRQLGENHVRSQALKKYLDRLPSRITIAGKRKG